MKQQANISPEYMLQQQLTAGEPQQIIVVQQALETDIEASKRQFIITKYYEMQTCCCCTFRFWSLFSWIFSLIGIIVWCIVAGVFIFLCAFIKTAVDEADAAISSSDTNGDAGDAGDAVDAADTMIVSILVIWIIVLVAGIAELVCVSVIIHGIRKHNYRICLFATVWSVLNAFASFAVIHNSAGIAFLSFGLFSGNCFMTAFHTYYLKKARTACLQQFELKIINS
eukprot:UN00652